jgi:hypothetical protein
MNKCGADAALECERCIGQYCSIDCINNERHIIRCKVRTSIRKAEGVFINQPLCGNKTCPNQDVKPTHVCGDCISVYYCSQVCQKAHWPIHKLNCTAFLRGFGHFKKYYPEINLEHIYDMHRCGHSVNECIREFTPHAYYKYTMSQYIKVKKPSRAEVRAFTKQIKKGMHIYIFYDPKRDFKIVTHALATLTKSLISWESESAYPTLDELD